MRLHLRECPECRRIAIRLDDEPKWCRWLKVGYVADIKAQHDVLTHESSVCGALECQQKHVAKTAGAVT